ncbi:hypothetical protein VTN00DRAFT_9020 [Thermoascus crustaceus]|uniref:uncharacterized protein n=1 Tax=Thermoascus crustaceus TaxID=5088 RepID=UPI00374249F0
MATKTVVEGDENQIHSELVPLLRLGLTSKPRWLPSLLLWDAKGLQLFEEITHSEPYYLFEAEKWVLEQNVNSITDVIKPNSVILELGSGSLEKTGIILEGLVRKQRPVDYYALDVSESELDRTLNTLRQRLNNNNNNTYVKCHPLVLTYEQSFSWLLNNPTLHGRDITILWLGSTIACESRQESIRLMAAFAAVKKQSQIGKLQFLIGVDGCKDPTLVSRAYDFPPGLTRKFALNCLDNANRVLSQQVFNPKDWVFQGVWDAENSHYNTRIAPTVDLTVEVKGHPIALKKGEPVSVIVSRKYGEAEVGKLVQDAGYFTAKAWKHRDMDYGFYQVRLE